MPISDVKKSYIRRVSRSIRNAAEWSSSCIIIGIHLLANSSTTLIVMIEWREQVLCSFRDSVRTLWGASHGSGASNHVGATINNLRERSIRNRQSAKRRACGTSACSHTVAAGGNNRLRLEKAKGTETVAEMGTKYFGCGIT